MMDRKKEPALICCHCGKPAMPEPSPGACPKCGGATGFTPGGKPRRGLCDKCKAKGWRDAHLEESRARVAAAMKRSRDAKRAARPPKAKPPAKAEPTVPVVAECRECLEDSRELVGGLCPDCREADENREECDYCDGSGIDPDFDFESEEEDTTSDCPVCGGSCYVL